MKRRASVACSLAWLVSILHISFTVNDDIDRDDKQKPSGGSDIWSNTKSIFTSSERELLSVQFPFYLSFCLSHSQLWLYSSTASFSLDRLGKFESNDRRERHDCERWNCIQFHLVLCRVAMNNKRFVCSCAIILSFFKSKKLERKK